MAEAYFSEDPFSDSGEGCVKMVDMQAQLVTCQNCGLPFATTQELQQHLMQKHTFVQEAQHEREVSWNQRQQRGNVQQFEPDGLHFFSQFRSPQQFDDFPMMASPVHAENNAKEASGVSAALGVPSRSNPQPIRSMMMDQYQCTSSDINQSNGNSRFAGLQAPDNHPQKRNPFENLPTFVVEIMDKPCSSSASLQQAETAWPESVRFVTTTGSLARNPVQGVLKSPAKPNRGFDIRAPAVDTMHYPYRSAGKSSPYEFHRAPSGLWMDGSQTPPSGRIHRFSEFHQNRNGSDKSNFYGDDQFSTAAQYSPSYNFNDANQPPKLYRMQATEPEIAQMPSFQGTFGSVLPAENAPLFDYDSTVRRMPMLHPLGFDAQGTSISSTKPASQIKRRRQNPRMRTVNSITIPEFEPISCVPPEKREKKQRRRKSSSPRSPKSNQKNSRKKKSSPISNPCTDQCTLCPQILTSISSEQASSVQSHSDVQPEVEKSSPSTSSHLKQISSNASSPQCTNSMDFPKSDESMETQNSLDVNIKAETSEEKDRLVTKDLATINATGTEDACPEIKCAMSNQTEANVQDEKTDPNPIFSKTPFVALKKLSSQVTKGKPLFKAETEVKTTAGTSAALDLVKEDKSLPTKRRKPVYRKPMHLCNFCKEGHVTVLSLLTHIKSHMKPYCHRCLEVLNTDKQLAGHVCTDYKEAFDIPRVTVTSKYGRKRPVLTDVQLIKKGRKI